jgi:hypothetical protein
MDAIRSVEKQRDVDARLIVIGHHPKQSAHARLFETLNAYRDRHDVMLFIGADMAIIPERLLYALIEFYRAFPEIDQTLFGVEDWFSGEQILGFLSWRRGVRHATSPDRLFTDVVKNSSRREFKIARPMTPLMLHGQQPSDLQAIRYGAQRAMKAAQSGKSSRWERLQSFILFARQSPTQQRMLAAASIAIALEDTDFGMRCISGDYPLNEDDLRRVQRRAEKPQLLNCLLNLTEDQSVRERLHRERRGFLPERPASRPKLLQRLNEFKRGRLESAPNRVPQESMEKIFYELLKDYT